MAQTLLIFVTALTFSILGTPIARRLALFADALGFPWTISPAVTAALSDSTGAAIGILSSVIPYRLELESLRRMPMRLFGVWMSLEPAVAALIGLALLGQHLSLAEWLAICCVMVACAGATQH